MRRSSWDEVEVVDEPDSLLLLHPGWTNDRETLVMAIREAGWFRSTGEAFHAAEAAELKWGWIGVTDQSTLAICSSDGIAAGTGEDVSDVLQVTLARITDSP